MFMGCPCCWFVGELITWRGIHLPDEFLMIGVPVIALGLFITLIGLWLICRVFLKGNPRLSGNNTVTLRNSN